MINIQSLRSTIIAQFAVILLPVIALLGYQTLTEAQRTASVDRVFRLHNLALEAKDRYAVFVNGAADAVDTSKLSRPALAALVDARDRLSQLGNETGLADLLETSGSMDVMVKMLAKDPGLPTLLKLQGQINSARDRIARAQSDYDGKLNTSILQSIDESREKTRMVMVVSAAALAITIWFVFRMIRYLSQPLSLAVSMADRIAGGQRIEEREFRLHADVGNLLHSLARMHLSLQRYRSEIADYNKGLEQKLHELAESQSSLAEAQRLAQIGNWHWSVHSPLAYWSDEMYRILGVDPAGGQSTMDSFLSSIDASERESVETRFRALRAAAGSFSAEHRIIAGDGAECIVFSQSSSESGADGQVTRLYGTIQDITKRKRAEQEIRRLALFDGLTGLPNRQYFLDQLDHTVARAQRAGERLAVMYLDLDRFKRINDTMGHAAGDALLKEFAVRLKQCVRTSDYVAREDADSDGTVARLAGDEFTISLVALSSPHGAAKVAGRILTAMAKPFNLDGQDVVVTTSIGIALYPEDGEQTDTLLKNADAAMYRAKELGKNTYQFFDKDMNTATVEKLSMENELRQALNRDQMVLFYQPKIDIRTGRITGVEALIRWQHPHWGLVPPMQFIPLAEEIGLIVSIGDWVLEEACRQLRAWDQSGLEEVSMAVNLASPSFRQPELGRRVATLLRRTNLPPGRLELEATESILMRDVGTTMTTLTQLRDLGVRISVDDFGTGYSSLSYLRRFPIDQLKIDRSFVKEVTDNSDDASITSAIISLAHSLRLDVVAEGVETVGQARFLREQNCHLMQGFLFSRPVPAAELGELLRHGPEFAAKTTELLRSYPMPLAVNA